MLTFLIWVVVLVLCWPLAILALLLYPIVWLLLLPFRLLGFAVEAHHDALERGAGRTVALHDERVVTRDDVSRVIRKRMELAPAIHHFHHVRDDRKRPPFAHVGVVVAGIRGEHQPADPRPHAHGLQALRVPTDVMH
jgi:hypothetical protein